MMSREQSPNLLPAIDVMAEGSTGLRVRRRFPALHHSSLDANLEVPCTGKGVGVVIIAAKEQTAAPGPKTRSASAYSPHDGARTHQNKIRTQTCTARSPTHRRTDNQAFPDSI